MKNESILDTLVYEASSLSEIKVNNREQLHPLEKKMDNILLLLEDNLPAEILPALEELKYATNEIVHFYADEQYKHGLAVGLALMNEAHSLI